MNKDNLKQYRIDNLKQAQATRKQDSLNRVNEAISQLQKRHEKINFRTIASVANVSVSYLYKYPEIKQRIAEIRNEQSSMVRQQLKPTVSTSQVKIAENDFEFCEAKNGWIDSVFEIISDSKKGNKADFIPLELWF